VADKGHRGHGGDHENGGGGERPGRQPCDAADAVARGAAAAHAGADADEKAADRDHDKACGHRRYRQRTPRERRQQRRRDQSRDEGDPPATVAAAQQAAEDAADAGDTAGQQHQQRGSQSDQRAADETGERGEVVHGRRVRDERASGSNCCGRPERRVLP
jgi:hypothetical protein